jgi:putative aldouronate transport system substrate-binding protein
MKKIITILVSLAIIVSLSVPNLSVTAETIAKEPIEINALLGPMNNFGVQDDSIATYLQNKFGITINIAQAGADWDQKIAIQMAAGDLMDLILFKTQNELTNAVKSNLVMPMDSLISKYGKDIVKNAPEMVAYSKESLSDGTGKLYGLGARVSRNPLVGANIHPGMYVMWDIFKKTKMSPPNTMDDMLKILQKMQSIYPKTPQGKKTYAITLWSDWDGVFMLLNEQGPALNMSTDSRGELSEKDLKTGKIRSVLDPNSSYIKGLKWLYDANRMGLLDPDSLTQKWDNALQKTNEGRILSVFWNWEQNMVNNSELFAKNPMHGYAPLFIKSSVYDSGLTKKYLGNSFYYAIGANTQYPERIMELLNYFYTPEGVSTLVNGEQGKYWNIKGGKASFTQDAFKQVTTGGKLSYDLNKYANLCGIDYEDKDPRTGEKYVYTGWSSYQKNTMNARDKDWSSVMKADTPTQWLTKNTKLVDGDPSAGFAPPQPKDIEEIVKRCGEVVKTNSWKAVFSKNLSQFNSYIKDMQNKCKAYGISKWDEYRVKSLAEGKKAFSKYVK